MADALVEKGLVAINGKTAKLGDKVNETDEVGSAHEDASHLYLSGLP